MLIIRDYDLPPWAPDTKSLGLLGNEMKLGVCVPSLGAEDTVCFLTGLGNGGRADHTQLILSNPDVRRWIVVVFSDDADAVAHYRENIQATRADVHWICWAPDATDKLKQMIKHSCENTCLIYSKHPHPGLEEFSRYLRSLLPKWQFHVAAGSVEDLKDAGWTSLILTGGTLDDFLLDLPDSLIRIPYFVLLHAQETVYAANHPGELTEQIAEFYRKSFRWNRDKLREQFYVTNVLYEDWYSFCRDHPENVPMLRNDPRLTVWDRYGLPLPVDDVSDGELLAFLSRFTGCRQLSEAMQMMEKG